MHINILDSDPEDIDSSDRQRPWGCDRTRPNEGQKTRHRGLPLSFHKQQHTYIYLSNYFLYLTNIIEGKLHIAHKKQCSC